MEVLHQAGALVGDYEGLEARAPEGVDEIMDFGIPAVINEKNLVAFGVALGPEGFVRAAAEGEFQLFFLGIPGFELVALPAILFDDFFLAGLVRFALLAPFAADPVHLVKIGVVLHCGVLLVLV